MCYHMNMIKHSIRYFNKKEVRAVWDNEQSMWWYSAVDFINILVKPNSPRRYWNNVKVRNPELSPFCGQLKLYADDGKKYVSDVINESGVRLLLTIIPSKYKKQVLNCIKFLKDRGFGKDISTGKGQFAYETSEEKLNITYINTKYFITLSRYIPTKDELNEIKNNSKYEIVSKQGRSKNGEIRKKIRFFKEGSIFKNNKEKYGQIIDSGKQNPSLEYGYAYKIPYFGGENI